MRESTISVQKLTLGLVFLGLINLLGCNNSDRSGINLNAPQNAMVHPCYEGLDLSKPQSELDLPFQGTVTTQNARALNKQTSFLGATIFEQYIPVDPPVDPPNRKIYLKRDDGTEVTLDLTGKIGSGPGSFSFYGPDLSSGNTLGRCLVFTTVPFWIGTSIDFGAFWIRNG